MTSTYDFSGIATAYNVECGDGRVILPGAFDHQHGTRVPLVWRHQHNDIANVLGHAFLFKDEKGIRAKAVFNTTEQGKRAKLLVQSGDITHMSVWANKLREQDRRVQYGMIRELSLVLSGQNPGATIDEVVQHSDDGYFDPERWSEDGYIIHSGLEIEMVHEELEEPEEVEEVETDETLLDILATFDDDQKGLVTLLMDVSAGYGLEDPDEDEESISMSAIYNTLTDIQKDVLHYMVGSVEEAQPGAQSTVQHSDEGESNMTHNAFQNVNGNGGGDNAGILSHDEMNQLIDNAIDSRVSSLRDSFMSHAGTYGVDNIDVLFPDAKAVRGSEPAFITEDMEWVAKVMDNANKSPFSRIKSLYADITADEARARGYVTGAEKFDEVFPLFQRTTDPQTIYKKQKLDRDDILDIRDFNFVAWLKAEMYMKLREEVARAGLISDGRQVSDPDKIKTDRIRPIYGDASVYATSVVLDMSYDTLDVIDAIAASRQHYKGSGNPSLFCSAELLNEMFLVRDTVGHRIYKTMQELSAALRVKEIVEVPPMTNVTRDDGGETIQLLGIVVNMRDYTFGAEKAGKTEFFDDFDLDFNQYKYLLETRTCGALTVPKAAVVIERNTTPL